MLEIFELERSAQILKKYKRQLNYTRVCLYVSDLLLFVVLIAALMEEGTTNYKLWLLMLVPLGVLGVVLLSYKKPFLVFTILSVLFVVYSLMAIAGVMLTLKYSANESELAMVQSREYILLGYTGLMTAILIHSAVIARRYERINKSIN